MVSSSTALSSIAGVLGIIIPSDAGEDCPLARAAFVRAGAVRIRAFRWLAGGTETVCFETGCFETCCSLETWCSFETGCSFKTCPGDASSAFFWYLRPLCGSDNSSTAPAGFVAATDTEGFRFRLREALDSSDSGSSFRGMLADGGAVCFGLAADLWLSTFGAVSSSEDGTSKRSKSADCFAEPFTGPFASFCVVLGASPGFAADRCTAFVFVLS